MSDFMTKAGRTLGQLFRRAREVGDDAAEVTNTKFSEMRLAGAIRRLASERETVLKQIGTKVYTLHTRGKVRNQDVAADCRKVDDLTTKIQELRRQIEELERKRAGLDVELSEITDETPVADNDDASPAAKPQAQSASVNLPDEELAPETPSASCDDDPEQPATEPPKP